MRALRSGDVFSSRVPVVLFWGGSVGTMGGSLFFFLGAMGGVGFSSWWLWFCFLFCWMAGAGGSGLSVWFCFMGFLVGCCLCCCLSGGRVRGLGIVELGA